jgi:hypothetical protein
VNPQIDLATSLVYREGRSLRPKFYQVIQFFWRGPDGKISSVVAYNWGSGYPSPNWTSGQIQVGIGDSEADFRRKVDQKIRKGYTGCETGLHSGFPVPQPVLDRLNRIAQEDAAMEATINRLAGKEPLLPTLNWAQMTARTIVTLQPDAPADEVAMALALRGQLAEALESYRGALATIESCLETSDAVIRNRLAG